MQVAVLTTSWPRDARDATGRFLANQVERLEAAGAEVVVVAPRSVLASDANAAHRGRLRGFHDYGLTGGAGVVANVRRRPWLLPLLLASMVRATRRAGRSVDVVHANWLLTAPIAALAGRPLVLTLHGSGTAGRFEDLGLAVRHPRAFRWLVRRAAVVTAVSALLADAAREAGAREAIEVPHGVDVPDDVAVRDDQHGAVTALFAGRLSPEKGIDVLVQAFEGLDGVHLVVAGDGPERALLDVGGTAPRAELLGFVTQEELGTRIGRASMLVVPSLREGFGVVALEAMARGVPVVASRVGGLARLVEHEVCGLLVEPGDARALRAAIERLRDDRELRERLGAAGRLRARERYGWPRVTEAMLDAYERAAPTRSGS